MAEFKQARTPIAERHSSRWYSDMSWKRRARAQMRREPFCRMCGSIATVADHIVPHRGDLRAWQKGELQSLCRDCHERKKKTEEHRGFVPGVGVDGYPTDSNHPFVRHEPAFVSKDRRRTLLVCPDGVDEDDEDFDFEGHSA